QGLCPPPCSRFQPQPSTERPAGPWAVLNRSESGGGAGSSPISGGSAHHHGSIQFASQSVSSTKVTTNIAPTIMSCPRRKFGRSAALVLLTAPPEHIEREKRSSPRTGLCRADGPGFFSGAAGR